MSELKELMARVQHSFAVMSQSKSWRKDEDSQTLKDILAILSESDRSVESEGLEYPARTVQPPLDVNDPPFADKSVDEDQPCLSCQLSPHDNVNKSGLCFTCYRKRKKPVEIGEYRVELCEFGQFRVVGPGFSFVLSNNPDEGNALFVAGRLNTLSTRIRELESDNQMHRLVARDSNQEQTNSYNTIQSLMDENSKLKEQIKGLEDKTEQQLINNTTLVKAIDMYHDLIPGAEEGTWQVRIVAVGTGIKYLTTENLKLKERVAYLEDELKPTEETRKTTERLRQQLIIDGLMKDEYSDTMPLTAEVETQKAEIERLREVLERSRLEIIALYDIFAGLEPDGELTGDHLDSTMGQALEDITTALAPASPQGEETKEESDGNNG